MFLLFTSGKRCTAGTSDNEFSTLRANGLQATDYCRMLREEGLIVNRMGIHKLLQKHRVTNNIERRPGSGRPTKMTAPVKALVEQQMRDDDETTAVQLHALPLSHGHTMTVLRCRAALGWTLRGSAYCHLIRQQNKVKRLQRAQEHLSDGFDNVIWTDAKRAQRSSNRARIVLHRFIQRRIVL